MNRVLEIGFLGTTRNQQKMSLFLKMFLASQTRIFINFCQSFRKYAKYQKILKWGEKQDWELCRTCIFTYRKEGPGPHSERLKGLTTLHASVDRQKLSLSHSSHIFTLPKLLYISGQASTYFGINFFHQILWEKSR